jgi:hypothetical protein
VDNTSGFASQDNGHVLWKFRTPVDGIRQRIPAAFGLEDSTNTA